MAEEFELAELDDGRACALAVRAQPGASRPRLVGVWNRRVKVAVAAPPERGRANDEVCALLAELLGLRRAGVALIAGERARDKRVRIALPADEARRRLLALLA